MDVGNPKYSSHWNKFYWLGIPLVILVLVISIYLYVKLKESEFEYLQEQLVDATDIITGPIQYSFQHYAQALTRMGKRWELRQGIPKDEWVSDAQAYFDDSLVFLSIEWVDNQMKVQYMVPMDQEKKYHGLDLSTLPKRAESLQLARQSKQTVISDIIDTIQGPKGLLIVHPLFTPRGFDGYMIGAMDITKLFNRTFLKNFDTNYGVAIYQDNVPLFSTQTKVVNPYLVQKKTIIIYNRKWDFYVWPTESLLNKILSPLPLLALLSGWIVAFLMLIFFYYFNAARENAIRMLEAQALHERAEAEQIRLASIVENSDDAILSVDLDGNVLTWNKGAERMYGYLGSEMIGKSVLEIYPKENKKDLFKYLDRIKRGEYIQAYDTSRLCKDGRIIPVSIVISPTRNSKGEIVGASSIARDISESKKIEKLKNEFISIVSHELRTPLTAIRGAIGILASGKICTLSEQAYQLLGIANSNCDRLIGLINNILDIEKIETGKIEFQFKLLDLNQLVQEVVEMNQSMALNNKVKLDFQGEEHFMVKADHDRLAQALTNLLSNAIRYSPLNGVVKIRLLNLVDKVRVSVIDNGPGIPKEFQSKIFGKFSQADSSDTRKQSGTGLGLSIAKTIIEKHHGTISFLTTQGKGTTFNFELPLEGVNQKDVEQAVIPQKKILICDPDVESGTFLKKLLQRKNIEADIAHSAREAKSLIAQHTYAAITIDLLLPDEDGIKLIKRIRQDEKTKNTPVVVISVKAHENEKRFSGDAFPVIDWIEKPKSKEKTFKILEYINNKFSTKIPNVLNIEDDQDVTRIISIMLQDKASVWNANSIAKAKKLLSEHEFDLVILDLNLPDGNGTELLPCINYKTQAVIPVIVFSIDELDKKYANLVKSSLLKSIATNDQLYQAIFSAIQSGGVYGKK